MRILDQINHPQDLNLLESKQLTQLAEEIRQELIRTTSQTGGHLAPNLGVVELTIALHLVFNSPQDKIIWDVGHQSYVHKLLTGRRDEFNTLRQLGGLSGFPKREENEHDVFGTGHSSTSISAALGFALARDLHKEKHNVIAVIGDGALTGGMSFEALNHLGHLQTNLIVILNDNEMSIVNNVGGLSKYLNRMRTDPAYARSKEEVGLFLKSIPKLGDRLLQAVDRVKDAVKYLVVPGMLFEELGVTYLGPVDGHNISAVQEILLNAQQIEGPVLIHLLTKKGKGYTPAEEKPDAFHGIGPFEIASGQPQKTSKTLSYTQVFGDTLLDIARRDERILAITAAMPGGTGLEHFAQELPDRFFDVGIAEQHAVTLAAGMACSGYRPVVAVYSTFLQRAYDQIIHDVCLQNLPVVFAVDRAGLVGEDGATHQGIYDLAFLRHIPNLTILAPKDENELQHCLNTAFTLSGPVALRYPRGTGTGVERETPLQTLPLGRAEILQQGRDLAIFTLGPMAATGLAVAQELGKYGLRVAVINARYVKPLDQELILRYMQKNARLVTLEEHSLAGGFGSAVGEFVCKNTNGNCGAELLSIGFPDAFIEHGSVNQLREKHGLTAAGIVRQIDQRWPDLIANKFAVVF